MVILLILPVAVIRLVAAAVIAGVGAETGEGEREKEERVEGIPVMAVVTTVAPMVVIRFHLQHVVGDHRKTRGKEIKDGKVMVLRNRRRTTTLQRQMIPS